MFPTKYVATLITPNKFYVPGFNCSVATAMKSKGKFGADKKFNVHAVMWFADGSVKGDKS
jgi:hypothetical protein